MRAIVQSHETMRKVLREANDSLCLPHFIQEDTPSTKSYPLSRRPDTMIAVRDVHAVDNQSSTLVCMSLSSTSTDEQYDDESCRTVDDLPASQIAETSCPTGLVVDDNPKKLVDTATQYDMVEDGLMATTTTTGLPKLTVTTTGTQYDLETQELAVQAVKETTSSGIQCHSEVASASTQAGPSVQCASVQVAVDTISASAQAVVDTKTTSTQAGSDTKTEGTQYELFTTTMSTQTEEQDQAEDADQADLREQIVSLVQKHLHKESAVLTEFRDINSKVRQFLCMMENSYKTKLEPRFEGVCKEITSSGRETQVSTATDKTAPAEGESGQETEGTVSELGVCEGIQSTNGLTNAVECAPVLSTAREGTSILEKLGKRKDIIRCEEKPPGPGGQELPGLPTGHRAEAVLAVRGQEYAEQQTALSTNTQGPRQHQTTKEEITPPNVHQYVRTSQPIHVIDQQRGDFSISCFNTLTDIGSSCQNSTSSVAAEQQVHYENCNLSAVGIIKPEDCYKPEHFADSKDFQMLASSRSVTLNCSTESSNIWKEIADALEGCEEPVICGQSVDGAKPKEVPACSSSTTSIPLPGSYWLTHPVSIPCFFLLDHDVPDRRGLALYLRGRIKSEGDKDHTPYNFIYEDATDFSQATEFALRPDDYWESQQTGSKNHVDSFAAQLSQSVSQEQPTISGYASNTRLQNQGYHNNSSRAYVEEHQPHVLRRPLAMRDISSFQEGRWNIAELPSGGKAHRNNTCNSHAIESRSVQSDGVHVEDFVDARARCIDVPNTGGLHGTSGRREITPDTGQASVDRCATRTTSCGPSEIKQLTGEAGGAVGGYPAKTSQQGLYQDASGYEVPDMDVPVVMKEDTEVQMLDDGSNWVLGAGSFGAVEAAFYKSPEGPIVEVAVKKYLRDDLDSVIREGKMMMFLQDTGIFPKFYGFMDIGEGNQTVICLVSELFGRGTTLADVIQGTQYHTEQKDWLSICIQLVKGLRQIHAKQVIFNDLKSNNVLVDISAQPVVKFIDLGISTFRQGITYNFTAEQLQPLRHIAPEVKRGAPTSVQSDIWGLGVLLMDIATVSGVPGLGDVTQAALAEDPQQRVCLDGITAALIAIYRQY